MMSKPAFSEPLSDLDFYWLGYFRADGHLRYFGNSIKALFAQKHLEPVASFKEFIQAENKVKLETRKSTWGSGLIYSIQSAKPAYALDRLGAKQEIINCSYENKHFWRGMIDGDGCLSLDRNSRPYISLCGTFYDMTKFSSYCSYILGTLPPAVTKVKSIFAVKYTGNKAKFLIDHLYLNEGSFLSYKRDIAHNVHALPYKNSNNTGWLPR